MEADAHGGSDRSSTHAKLCPPRAIHDSGGEHLLLLVRALVACRFNAGTAITTTVLFAADPGGSVRVHDGSQQSLMIGSR
jgi:hypothetical protein